MTIARHELGKENAIGGRRIGHSIGSGLDGAADTLLRGAAGGNDGNFRKVLPNIRHDVRGRPSAGDVQNISAGVQTAADIRGRTEAA